MKHLLFLLLGVPAISEAQKIRFTDTANRWTFEHQQGIYGEATYDTYTYRIGADTIIGGKVYKKVDILSDKVRWDPSPNASHQGGTGKVYIGVCFREDTIANRVYSITYGDTAERVIFDAAWQAGDSVAWRIGPNHGINKVVSRDSAWFNNAWHLVFRMQNYFIVEGIGTNKGTAFAAYPSTGENTPNLRCFSHGGYRPPLVLPGNSYDNLKSCAAALGVNGTTAAPANIVIVPNPGGMEMRMILPAALGRGMLRLTDMLGRTIYRSLFQSPCQLSLGQVLPVPGIYCYHAEDAAGNSYSGRFVFQ